MTPDKQIKVDIIANAIQVIIPRFGLIDCFMEDAAEKEWEREKRWRDLQWKKHDLTWSSSKITDSSYKKAHNNNKSHWAADMDMDMDEHVEHNNNCRLMCNSFSPACNKRLLCASALLRLMHVWISSDVYLLRYIHIFTTLSSRFWFPLILPLSLTRARVFLSP